MASLLDKPRIKVSLHSYRIGERGTDLLPILAQS